jgi:hypothetical protein
VDEHNAETLFGHFGYGHSGGYGAWGAKCPKRTLAQIQWFHASRVNTGEERGLRFGPAREMPFRALSQDARKAHEYWLESRFEGQKQQN